MKDIQSYMDGFSAGLLAGRKKSGMTLGRLIETLESMPADAHVERIGNPHSYRGYYSDLAFEREPWAPPMTAAEAVTLCRRCLGQTYEGYKGGEYVMDADSPVWLASWGCCGLRIVGIDGGKIISKEEEP